MKQVRPANKVDFVSGQGRLARAAAKRLAGMGSTMPKLREIPRRRLNQAAESARDTVTLTR